MTTVKEFIKYLQELPPETEVSVIIGYDSGYYHGTDEVELDLSTSGNVDFIDFTGNRFISENDKRFNKKYLILGEK